MNSRSGKTDTYRDKSPRLEERTTGHVYSAPAVLWRILIVFSLLILARGTAFSQGLVGPGKVFIRFTNLRGDGAKVLIRVHVVPNNDKPFGWAGWTTYAGRGEGTRKDLAEKWLSAGEQSGWVDIGRGMNLRGARSPDTYLAPVLCGVETSEQRPGLALLAEVAYGEALAVARRIEVHKPDLKQGAGRDYPWVLGYSVWNGSGPFLPTLGLLVPTRPELHSRVYSLEEALRWQLDFIEEFPQMGRAPTQVVFKTRGRGEILEALGYNGYPEGTVEGNFGDEICISLSMPVEEQNRRFREHLRAKGIDPLELIAGEKLESARQLSEEERWNLVVIEPSLADRPVQYYESAGFRYRLWYEELAARTEKFKSEHPGKEVLTGANFSPHMNVWPDVRQWIGPFRAGAMTMTWTEDWWWQIPEVSPQVYGFLLDGLRLAGSYHGAPGQFYVMPFHGSSPDNFRRMNALGLAHGAKILNHFHTESQVLTTWDYVDVMDSPRMYQAIHDVIRDAGAIEHRLYPAMPRQALIAIMLSRAGDTWDTEDIGGGGHLYSAQFNVNNEERKAIWLALRHAQYPVDLITDEDIADGRLGPYKVLYIVGSEMLGAAAGPLKEWVRAGGVVYATGGGGLLDEHHRPIATLYEMYGIAGHKLVRHSRHVRPRQTLRGASPQDTLTVDLVEGTTGPTTLEAYFYREILEPGAGKLAGAYRNGDKGAVVNSFGEGRTLYCGALAGMAYIKSALRPPVPTLPESFSEEVRRFITTVARWARIIRPVVASEPLVETQYLSGPKGDMVLLVNWRDKPVKDLVVSFPDSRDIRSIRSLRRAGYFKGHLHEQQRGALAIVRGEGTAAVRMDLGIWDCLLVD